MASEYQLNLKAVLDSTQVQQELNKLRQSTSQALGGENARSNAQAPSGNLTSLGSTLNNLNQTLNRLNQTLGQLRGIAPHSSQPRPQSAIPPIISQIGSSQQNWQSHPYGFGKFTDLVVQREVANAVRNALSQKADTAWMYQTLDDISHGIFGPLVFDKKLGVKIGAAGTNAQRQIFGNYFSGSTLNDLINNKDLANQSLAMLDPYGPEAVKPRLPQKKINDEMIRSMRLLAGQYVLGELNGVGEMIGGRTGAAFSGSVQGAQSGLMTGAMISMMGANPAYAAAAGIAVAAAKISSVMLEYAQKLSQAAERSYALLSRSKQQIGEQYKAADNIRFSRGLRDKDFQQLTELKSQYDASTESAYSKYMTLSEGQQNALSTARQEYLERIGGTSDIDERQKIEQEYADAVAKIAGSVNKAKEQWEDSAKRQQEINAALEAVKSEYKERRSYRYYLDRRGAEGYSDTDIASRSSIWSQRASRIQEELNAEIAKNDMSEEGMRRRRRLQSMYGEYQSEADFWEKQSKSRESAREDIQKNILAQERIREIEALTKKYDFSKGYSSDENRRDILKDFEGSRLDIGGQYMQSQRNVFGLQQQMMQALKEASSEGISAEDRAAKLKEASSLDEQIQNEKNRMNVLGAAYTSLGGLKVEELQDALSRLQAPSKDRATSLAQYGYNMGEKGDDEQRWESELQYLKDQKQIQDDIKAILNDKLPAPATFA